MVIPVKTFPGSEFINIQIVGFNEFFNTTYMKRNHLIITALNKLFHFGLYLVDRLTHAEILPGINDLLCCRIFCRNIGTHILTDFSKGGLGELNFSNEYKIGKRKF
jgi:hypothetical protein